MVCRHIVSMFVVSIESSLRFTEMVTSKGQRVEFVVQIGIVWYTSRQMLMVLTLAHLCHQ